MLGGLELPDEVSLTGLFSLDRPAALQKITKFRIFRSCLKYISIPGFVLLALALVLVSGPQKCFRWIGGGMLAAGLTFLPGLLIFKQSITTALTAQPAPFLTGTHNLLEGEVVARALLNAAAGAAFPGTATVCLHELLLPFTRCPVAFTLSTSPLKINL